MKDYKRLSDYKIIDTINRAIYKVNKSKEYNPSSLTSLEKKEVVNILANKINLSKDQLYFYFDNGNKSKCLKDDFLKIENLYDEKEYYDVLTLINKFNNSFILEKIIAIVFITFSLILSVVLLFLQLYYGLIITTIIFLLGILIFELVDIKCRSFSNVEFDLDTSKIVMLRESPYKIKLLFSEPHKNDKNIELLGIKFYYNVAGVKYKLTYLSNVYRVVNRRYFISNKLNSELIEKFNKQITMEYYENTNLIRINSKQFENILSDITKIR